MRRSKGYRSRTRHLLRKKPYSRGLRTLSYLLVDHKIGDKVIIDLDPAQHKGQPHRRYHGKQGIIVERRGRAFVVDVQDGSKIRKIIARLEHIRPL